VGVKVHLAIVVVGVKVSDVSGWDKIVTVELLIGFCGWEAICVHRVAAIIIISNPIILDLPSFGIWRILEII
jgi:hypothetical protein